MASSDPRSGAAPPPWLRWFGNRRKPDPCPQATPAEEEAVDLIDQAEAFQTLRIRDVMTPRADIVALEISLPLDEVVRRFARSELTRMPIYRETLDDPVGVVHIKDIVLLLAPPEDPAAPPAPIPWKDPVLHRLRREALYVPASMLCSDLLLRMRVW